MLCGRMRAVMIARHQWEIWYLSTWQWSPPGFSWSLTRPRPPDLGAALGGASNLSYLLVVSSLPCENKSFKLFISMVPLLYNLGCAGFPFSVLVFMGPWFRVLSKSGDPLPASSPRFACMTWIRADTMVCNLYSYTRPCSQIRFNALLSLSWNS